MPAWLLYILVTGFASVPFYWHVRRRGGAAADGFASRYRRMLWIPAITAFALRVLTGQGFQELRYDAGVWPMLVVAVLLPFVVEVVLIVVVTQLGWARLSPQVVALEGGEVHVGETVELLMDERRQSPPRFLANLILTITVGGVFSTLFTFGAEFGWRAYLFSRATTELGLAGGVLVAGLAWGYWHLPLVLGGYRYPAYPRLGAWILMPLSTIALSVIAGWLYVDGASLWAPALFHAGLLVNVQLSRHGLAPHGDDLRVQLLWTGLWWVVAAAAWWLLSGG